MSDDRETIDAYGSEREIPFEDLISGRALAYRRPDGSGGSYDQLREFPRQVIQNAVNDHQSWEQREPISDRQIEEYRRSGHGNARLDLYIQFVDRLRNSGFDDVTKIQAVQAFFGEMLHYDGDKANSGDIPDRIQTTYDTITSGHGVCDDMAHAKYATLKAVGISDENMRIVGGALGNCNFEQYQAHEILMVNAQGRNYALDAISTDAHAANSLATETGWVQSLRGMSTGLSYFVPLISYNAHGIHAYTMNYESGAGMLPPQTELWRGLQPAGRPDVRGELAASPQSSISINIIDPYDRAHPDQIDMAQIPATIAAGQEIIDLVNSAHDLNPVRRGEIGAGPAPALPRTRPDSRPSLKCISRVAPEELPSQGERQTPPTNTNNHKPKAASARPAVTP